MKYRKCFYDIPGIIGDKKLQGSITISMTATKKAIINKIVARHFYGQPIIGWQIDKINFTCVEKED